MSGDDGRPCCILAVCCPPGSPQQRAALEEALLGAETNARRAELATVERQHADYIIDNYDLAPKGSLELLKEGIALMARASK